MATERKFGSKTTPEYERKIEIACKRLSVKALELLTKVMSDEGAETRWRLQAAKEILDRGLGKPRQQVDQKITMVGGDAFMEALNAAKARVEAAEAIVSTEAAPEGVVH